MKAYNNINNIKLFNILKSLFKDLKEKNKKFVEIRKSKKFKIKVKDRSMVILPCFIGIHFDIHNGSDKYQLTRITDKMVGLKFGELSFTRKRAKHKVKK